MKDVSQIPARLASVKRQRWICFFLAFFLLYNPFQAAPRGSRTLDVCHPASNRATVGASELQHFTPAAGWDSVPAVDVSAVEAPWSQPVVTVETSLAESRPAIPPAQFVGADLWFRPPPSR
ncbi:MAG TPA: hypothetical protein VEI73_04350 [Candidatus Acidoferrum sp.]|nr:hypothetical protein [Candidatus Acidoferrum sp.]